MPYVNPKTARSPRTRLEGLTVIFEHESKRWAAARFMWDGHERLGLRWNGSEDGTVDSNPTSRGFPTWFVVPEELAEAVEVEIERIRSRE